MKNCPRFSIGLTLRSKERAINGLSCSSVLQKSVTFLELIKTLLKRQLGLKRLNFVDNNKNPNGQK